MNMKRFPLVCWVILLIGCQVSKPSVPTVDSAGDVELVGHVGGVTRAVLWQGGYVYAGFGSELAILDISDPISPERVGYVVLPGIVEDIVVVDHYAYVHVTNYNGLVEGDWIRVVDISDLTNPFEVQEMPGDGVKVVGHYAYVRDREVLRLVDVSDLAALNEVSSYNAPGTITGLTVVGSYVYAAWVIKSTRQETSRVGLDVVDVSTPATPRRVSSLETPKLLGDSLVIVGDYACVSGYLSGLHLIDVSCPRAPVYVENLTAKRTGLRSVAAVGDRIYMAHGDGALTMLDISDPGNPVKAYTVLLPGSADMTVVRDYIHSTYGVIGHIV